MIYSLAPVLDEKYVAKKIYDSLMHYDKEVYIPWSALYNLLLLELMPLSVLNYISKISFGEPMKDFVGRTS
jgi:hypothetical protein